jgi:hypothetical protein
VGTKNDLVTLTLLFDLLIKNINLGYIFWMVCTRTLIFIWVFFFWQDLSMGTNRFDLVPWPWCLTYTVKILTMPISFEWCLLELWYFTWEFVWQVFSVGINRFDLVTLTLMFDLLTNSDTVTLDVSFEWYVLGFWYFTWVFVVTRPFRGYKQVWPCDLHLCVWPTYRKK